jgi:hypothetical protein
MCPHPDTSFSLLFGFGNVNVYSLFMARGCLFTLCLCLFVYTIDIIVLTLSSSKCLCSTIETSCCMDVFVVEKALNYQVWVV